MNVVTTMPDTLPQEPPKSSGMSDRVALLIPISLWFGLVTGLTEVLLHAVRRHVLGRFIQLGRDIVWLAPLADLLIFGALGLLMYALAPRRDRRVLRWGISVCAFLSVFTVLLMYYPIHPWARVALAAGIAVQFGRVAARWLSPFIRIVDTTLTWPVMAWRRLWHRRAASLVSVDGTNEARPDRRDFLVGAGATIGALAAGVHILPFTREWLAAKPLAPIKPSTPNVLLVVLDTVRAASLGMYGYERETTPNLDRLARRGALFTRAYSHSSWTLPAHRSLFTGCYAHELSTTWQTALDSKYPTLAEVLTAAGYATAGFVANTNYCSYESGLDRGFLRYEDYPVSVSELINSSALADSISDLPPVARRRQFDRLGRRQAASINRRLLSWLDGTGHRPFFAFVNYFEAHAPYVSPSAFAARFGSDSERPNPRHGFGWRWTPEQEKAEQAAYEAAIAYLDSEMGALFSALESRGVLDTTLVIVTSDHGELFGEHGLMDHANSLYAPLLHVPLFMVWPGRIPSGVSIREPVGLRHIPATILDLAGVDAVAGLRGRSLTPLWREAEGRQRSLEPVLSSLERGIRVDAHWRNANADLHSLIVGNQHYIRSSDGGEEMYDLVSDPAELTNIADRSDLESFRTELDRLLRQGSHPS